MVVSSDDIMIVCSSYLRGRLCLCWVVDVVRLIAFESKKNMLPGRAQVRKGARAETQKLLRCDKSSAFAP